MPPPQSHWTRVDKGGQRLDVWPFWGYDASAKLEVVALQCAAALLFGSPVTVITTGHPQQHAGLAQR
jgi:hypothetical protein